MNIPNYDNSPIVGSRGYLSDQWSLILQQLITELQNGVGGEGFAISNVSSDPVSVTPPAVGGQLSQVQTTFGQPDGVLHGTIVFDPYEVNGAILPLRNGQLKVMLNDGMFHSITNS